MRTGSSQSTRTTTHCWPSNGMEIPSLTPRFPSGCALRLRFFPLWRTHWPGSCGQGESNGSSTTWMIICSVDPRAVRHPQTPWCWHWRHVKSWVCQWTFLGIQIDTVHMRLSLADDKLERVRALVLSWRGRHAATKRELQALIGHLSHAAFVVLPGRTFLRRMIDTMSLAKRPHHNVRLTTEFRSDLHWWASFLPLWNGRSILPASEPGHVLTTDASGRWGYGAVTEQGEYFQLKWPDSWAEVNIAVKELVPVVIAVAMWGQQWAERTVLVRCDNMAVVHALATGTARDCRLMHKLRCLHFFSAQHQIHIQAEHLAGSLNSAADALSRNNMSLFLHCTPQAAKAPSPVPEQIVNMLVLLCPDWTSAAWRAMFLTTWGKHWHRQHFGHTARARRSSTNSA